MTTNDEAAPRRPFRIGDGLLFIGATALAIALVRIWRMPRAWAGQFGMLDAPGMQVTDTRRFHYALAASLSWTYPFALMFTFAVLIARLGAPRSTFKRMATQPGVVACAAATLPIVFRMVFSGLCWILGYLTRPNSAIQLPSPPFTRQDNPAYRPPLGEWIEFNFLTCFPNILAPPMCTAVIAVWSVLWISGNWHSEPTWIDRMGRALGVYWIVLAIFFSSFTYVWQFLMM